MSITENIHHNHRKRLRAKVEKNGLNSLAEHEILEFLLTYVIPRKDTNPLAHALINKFGKFSNVLDASIEDLKTVKGIGENAALFLKTLSQTVDFYKVSKNKQIGYKLDSIQNCVQYFRANYEISENENLYIICLTNKFNVFKTLIFEGDDAEQVMGDTRKIAQLISNPKVTSIVLFHTHPNGDVNPSAEDFKATKRVVEICDVIGIGIVDHIILNETTHHSMRANNQIN